MKSVYTCHRFVSFVMPIFFLSIGQYAMAQQAGAEILKTAFLKMYGSDPGFVVSERQRIIQEPHAPADAFAWECKGRQIWLYAQNNTAAVHAAYHFLETVFKVEYLSADAVLWPTLSLTGLARTELDNFRMEQKKLLLTYRKNGLPYKYIIEKPAFQYREIFYGECRRADYAAFHGLSVSKETKQETHPGWGLWVHTLHRLLPPQVWFEPHPEYYALRNGIRMKDQVCMSSDGARKIVAENLRKEMQANPTARYWSVSQMDNYNYCECDRCAAADREEGAHSGSLLRFVNSLARLFPDKVISTLSYQYSRSAPKLTRPEPNVNIMLCTIESDRNKPIAGTSFEKDLSDWSKLTQNILIWDYVINFSHLIAPFPNWQVLGPNLQLFRQYGVSMIFEQGYNSPSSEMQPLRAYLLSKLVWNPNLNTDSLSRGFLNHYYGAGGEAVYQFIQAQTEALNQSGKALTLYEPPAAHLNGYLSYEQLQHYYGLLNTALLPCKENASDSAIAHRLDMVMQSLRYALLECMKFKTAGAQWIFALDNKGVPLPPAQHGPFNNKPTYEEILQELVNTANAYGPPIFHEVRLSPNQYLERTHSYWNNAYTPHKAMNKKVQYRIAPDKVYRDGSILNDTAQWQINQSINNGMRGGIDYQFNWMGWWGNSAEMIIDLGQTDTLAELTVPYLENNLAWIVGPARVEFEALGYSEKTKQFYTLAKTIKDNPNAGKNMEEGVYVMELQLPEKTACRYVRINVVNPGLLPAWRGVNDKGWLFLDELIIK